MMTVTSPISLSTATGDATSAETALISARDSFVLTMDGLEATLFGDYASHQITAEGLVDGAESLFDSNVGLINSGLTGILTGLASGFDGLVDGHEATLDGALLLAQGGFTSGITGLNTILTGALAAAHSFFDGQLSMADGTLTGTLGGLQTALDGIVSTQQGVSQSNIAGFNSAFETFANGQDGIYDAQETGFWSNYLAATDSSPTGLQGIYAANATAAESVRDGVLASYPSVTYDPEILDGTPAYESLIDGANSTLDNDLLIASNNYDSNVLGHLGTFDTAMNGAGGAFATFDSLMDTTNSNFDSAMQTADANYNGIVDAAQSLYDNTVNGPGGLVATFESNVAGYKATYDGAVAIAESIRNGLIDSAVSAFDSTVAAAEQAYNDWLTGKAGAGVTTTTVITHYQPTGFLGTESWSVTTTQTDSNGNSSTTSSVGLKSAPAALGTLMASSVSSTTIGGVPYTVTVEMYQEAILPTDSRIGNVYFLAIQDRTAWMEQTLDDLSDQIDDALEALRGILDGQVSAANDAYNNLANDATTGFVTLYQNAINAANTSAGINSATHYNNYQDTINPMMTGGMDPITMLPITPNWAAIYQATQDYALNVQAEEITWTNNAGVAFVSYVSAERAADTSRDLQIVSAVDSYLQQAITAIDGYYAAAMTEVMDWLRDVTDINADFERQDAQEFANMENTVNNAAQGLGLAENSANEGFAIAESNAALALTQGVAGEVETLRNGEMGARIGFLQTEAFAAEGWEIAFANALAGWLGGAANALNQFTILATNAEEQLQNDVLGEQTVFVGAATSALQAWMTTVSNGVESLWSAARGGGSDITAVAGAWKNADQAITSEWKNLTDGEVAQFQAYGLLEAGARKSAQQNVAAQNVVRGVLIGGELVAYAGVVAPAVRSSRQNAVGAYGPWMLTAAAGERGATNMTAAASNAFELAAAPLARTANDGTVNATHAFVGSVLGDWTPYQQSIVTQQQIAQNARIGEFDLLATSSRIARTAQAQADRASWQVFASSAAPAEDGLITDLANHQKAQAVLGSVIQFNCIASQSPNDFASCVGMQRPFMPMASMTFAGTAMNDGTAQMAGASTAMLGGTLSPNVGQHTQTASKPQVTVNTQGQIIGHNLSFWDATRLRANQILHPRSLGRPDTTWSENGRTCLRRAGSSSRPVPTPTLRSSRRRKTWATTSRKEITVRRPSTPA